MFKTSSKKILLSLLVSSFMMPIFASSPLENYIDQTINGQNTPTNDTPDSKRETINELLAMDHYERHTALAGMLDKIQAGADKKNATDLFLLGYYYYSEAEDNLQEADYNRAKDYFTQAEKLGSKDAIYLLGELYYYGEGVTQDYLKAAEYYEKAAALKQREAIFSLGLLYMNGFGFDENPTKAIEYYKQAAALDDNVSLNALGYYYKSGDIADISIDLTEAAKWYQKSCDNGNSDGCDEMNRLKIHTLTFDSVLTETIDKYGAIKATNRDIPAINTFIEEDNYDKSAMLADYLPEIIAKTQENDPDATFLLGFYYEVKGDDDYDAYAYGQAKVLYDRAIELGSTEAIYSLAELYYYGNGVEQDYEKSLALYANPKLDSRPEAIFSLAVQYDAGEGVAQNYEVSFNLFQKAAALGHMPSTFNVGYMYEYGEFVDIDYEMAKKWYQQACDNNYSDSCNAVNIIDDKINDDSGATDSKLEYLFNEIMEHDKSKAALELTSASVLSAKKDDARAFLKSQTDTLLESVKTDNDAESLFLTGYLFYLEALENHSDHTYAQAYTLMEKAANQGFSEANFYLGVMNFHGYGVDQDYQKSRELLETLKDSNHAEAIFYLATIYDEGLGIEIDQEVSFELYRKAAALNHADSTYNVGFMYHYGEFVTENSIEAQKWYEKSCALGDLDGCEQSALLMATLNPTITAQAVLADDAAPQKEHNPIRGGIEDFFNNILKIF